MKPESTLTVKRPVLARVLGVSVRTVATLEQAGVIVPAARGKGGRASTYDLAVVVPAYLRHMTAPVGSDALPEVRRRIGLARAQLLELKHARESARVIDVEEARTEAFDSARIIRENILNLPARVGPEVAAVSDPTVAMAVLERELRTALGHVADALEAAQ